MGNMISHSDNGSPWNFRESSRKVFRKYSVYSINALPNSSNKCAVGGKQLNAGLG